jgi:hypothetical protein
LPDRTGGPAGPGAAAARLGFAMIRPLCRHGETGQSGRDDDPQILDDCFTFSRHRVGS